MYSFNRAMGRGTVSNNIIQHSFRDVASSFLWISPVTSGSITTGGAASVVTTGLVQGNIF